MSHSSLVLYNTHYEEQTVLFPSARGSDYLSLCSHLQYYTSKSAPAPGNGLRVTFSSGRDEYGSMGATDPCVFRAHHGGSDENEGKYSPASNSSDYKGPALGGYWTVMDSNEG